MVFFFGLMTKEVVEATAPGGVLHPWRRALLPVIAAVGVGAGAGADPPGRSSSRSTSRCWRGAWPVTLATDIAVSYFVARLIFGAAQPAIPFAMLLAIASDALGFLALALVEPQPAATWTGGRCSS